jgi:hypothetical protein
MWTCITRCLDVRRYCFVSRSRTLMNFNKTLPLYRKIRRFLHCSWSTMAPTTPNPNLILAEYNGKLYSIAYSDRTDLNQWKQRYAWIQWQAVLNCLLRSNWSESKEATIFMIHDSKYHDCSARARGRIMADQALVCAGVAAPSSSRDKYRAIRCKLRTSRCVDSRFWIGGRVPVRYVHQSDTCSVYRSS